MKQDFTKVVPPEDREVVQNALKILMVTMGKYDIDYLESAVLAHGELTKVRIHFEKIIE